MNGYFDYLERSRGLRTAVFALVFAWILINPAGSQVLGLQPGWLHSWTMFHRVGVGLYDVAFYEASGAELQPVSWPIPERPPHTIRHVVPPPERLLQKPWEVRWVIDRLCADAADPAALRGRIRRAALNGWEVKVDTGSPLCSQEFDVE